MRLTNKYGWIGNVIMMLIALSVASRVASAQTFTEPPAQHEPAAMAERMRACLPIAKIWPSGHRPHTVFVDLETDQRLITLRVQDPRPQPRREYLIDLVSPGDPYAERPQVTLLLADDWPTPNIPHPQDPELRLLPLVYSGPFVTTPEAQAFLDVLNPQIEACFTTTPLP